MNGVLYYEKLDAERNEGFIHELMKSAESEGMNLSLVHSAEEVQSGTDFILFRSRDPETAKWLESKGYRLFNRAEVNKIANDKWNTFQLASVLGIRAVPTKMLNSLEQLDRYPVVLKTADGHGGQEVACCDNEVDAEAFIEQYRGRTIIVQPYIESNNTDVRVFIVGDEVVGAVKRTGKDSFKSNYTLGGSIERYELTSSQEMEALTIARAIKSDYIGVDFLLLQDGTWMLNEIEDPVGARSFYETHDENIADLLIKHIKERSGK